MEDDYEFEPSQSEIDEIYNNDYWLNVELPKILRETKKEEQDGESTSVEE